ncbi:nose resistant to fluoxetine protein 6-like [Aethina tumida]|uniref:nose resistant to fluoxetine protein 6-like n=1 Tax=Aethina tumida TaxID=116153 RepID=UPI0021491AF9|nr:nose resistant to fluoxetine protein 6-like [Aethina tumida]
MLKQICFVFLCFVLAIQAEVLEYEEILREGAKLGDVSPVCSNQINAIPQEALVQMYDASSRILTSGLFYSSPSDLGVYDQCLAIKFDTNTNNLVETGIGKHCVGVKLNLIGINVTRAFCVPDGCSISDLQLIFNNDLPIDWLYTNWTEAKCSTINTGKDLDGYDITVICVFAVILMLMIMSTVYDVICKRQSKPKIEVLTAFSIYTNTKKLLHASKGSREQIQIFHGLKFISMMWIIAGHGMVGVLSTPLINLFTAGKFLTERYNWYISSAPLAVDTFFFISGFLLPYTYLKQGKGRSMAVQVKALPMFYIHRYLRLTPGLAAIYLVSISIFRRFGSGPSYLASTEGLAETCKKRAWPFFTYLQNYYNYDNLCLTQTWYVAADMQMYVISPIVLIPTAYYIAKKYKTVMWSLVGVVVFSVILPLVIKFSFQDYDNSYDTHTRLPNYFMGFLFGVYLRENIDKPFLLKKHASIINLILWIASLLLMLAICLIYGDFYVNDSLETPYSYVEKSVFYVLMRPAWSLGLCWIIYSSYHGYGGVVNWLLTRPNMQVGSRLTFCLYLVHGSVITHYILETRSKVYFSDYYQFVTWCGYFIVSLIVAFIWALAFESPFVIIEKFIFGGAAKRQPRKDKELA